MREDILRERQKKLQEYELDSSAFPARLKGERVSAADYLDRFHGERKIVAGRIFSLRDQGKIIFCDIKDASGKLQIVISEKETDSFALAARLDPGDIIEVEGEGFTNKKGEKGMLARSFRLLAKALLPMPGEWYGIEDAELRFRKRYLDFLLNDEAKELFIKKAAFWATVRKFLIAENFLEVETPVFEPIPGGAEAEPFVTHLNALDEDFYLRISLELPLKKLLVGGYERVFEIGRIFRNEGIDREHLQDYTQMECYAAYKDYEWMMEKTQTLYQAIVFDLFGSLRTSFGGTEVEWSGDWPRVEYYEIFERETGISLEGATEKELLAKAKSLGIAPEPFAGKGRLIDLVFKKAVRPLLVQPCFLINPPAAIEPLAKRMEEDPARVERFQIMACGTELGKGFSELNDPRDQRARFEEQMRLREGGDKEAQMFDEGFLEALEHGMPPAAGFGMSERLFAVFMGKPVRETTIFPLMRKEK